MKKVAILSAIIFYAFAFSAQTIVFEKSGGKIYEMPLPARLVKAKIKGVGGKIETFRCNIAGVKNNNTIILVRETRDEAKRKEIKKDSVIPKEEKFWAYFCDTVYANKDDIISLKFNMKETSKYKPLADLAPSALGFITGAGFFVFGAIYFVDDTGNKTLTPAYIAGGASVIFFVIRQKINFKTFRSSKWKLKEIKG